MSSDAGRSSGADRALSGLALASVWCCYLPLGAKYASTLAFALCAALLLHQRRGWARWRQAPTLPATLGLLLMLALSAGWSLAAWPAIGSHLWQYSLLLLVPLIGSACPAAVAQRALAHFALGSALVGLLFMLADFGGLPAWPLLWHTTVQAEGNQRIATSVLLALGACLALWCGLREHRAHLARRAAWALAVAVCVAGLALQDRRSGMLLLPVLLLTWALMGQRAAWQRWVVVAAILIAALAVWQSSDGVRSRFAEGVAELQQLPHDDSVATSWGQRLRMWELTATMVQERPWAGHGVASWTVLWRDRVQPGTLLATNSTPHNEYLLLAQQLGTIGVVLWLWLLLVGLRHAARAGPAGVPALMLWTAIAWSGLFNAVLRDAKFALPLLLLAALAMAAAGDRGILARTPDEPGAAPQR